MDEMNQQSPILPWEREGRERGGREGVGVTGVRVK